MKEKLFKVKWLDEMGEQWMNIDNLKELLFTSVHTKRDLLEVEEIAPEKKWCNTCTEHNCDICKEPFAKPTGYIKQEKPSLAQDEEKCICEIPHLIKVWENKCIYHMECNKCSRPIKQEKPEPQEYCSLWGEQYNDNGVLKCSCCKLPIKKSEPPLKEKEELLEEIPVHLPKATIWEELSIIKSKINQLIRYLRRNNADRNL